jgi:GntR family transcriptional regulator, transcriptional repressor for pyruvate dehydrogenase complex
MIVRKRVSQQIMEEIKKKIQNGEFPIDSKLPSENDLAKMFNVSRVPIREALSALASHGIIETVHGGGNYVRSTSIEKLLEQSYIEVITYEQIIELLETRIILETKAAALAALRHDEEDLKKMQEAQAMLFEELEEQQKIGDEADVLFHKSIINSTKNEVLIQIVQNLSDIYNRAVKASLALNTKIKGKKRQVYQEHQAIFKAITLRDSATAEKLMYDHLYNSMNKLKSRKEELENTRIDEM